MVARVGFTEGFDHYVGMASGNGGLNSVWAHSSPTGESNDGSIQVGLGAQGKCLYMASNAFGYSKTLLFENGDNDTLLSLAFSIKLERLDGASTLPIMSIISSTNVEQFTIEVSPLGKLVVLGEGLAVLYTSTLSIQVGIEYRGCLTVDMSVANSVVLNLWLNGTQYFTDVTGDYQDSGTQNMAGLRFHGHADFNNTDATQYKVDDILAILGAIQNLGQVALYLFSPINDVLHQWTHSTGASGFGVVDEKPMNITDYNSSAAVGLRDLFGFTDIGRVPDIIHCVTQITGTAKEESGARQIKNVLMVGGVTEELSANYSESQTYTFLKTHRLVNPVTGLAWTQADFDALVSGYEDAA